jgi:hypothetical protein
MSAMSVIPFTIILGGYCLIFLLPWHEPEAGGRLNGSGMNEARQQAKRHLSLAVLRRPRRGRERRSVLNSRLCSTE